MFGWNEEHFNEFNRSLADIGAKMTSWIEVIQYTGNPVEVNYKLSVKYKFFSKINLAASIDEESLLTLRSYIKHHPDYKSWKLYVTKCDLLVNSGDYMIVERRACKGGRREDVANVIKRFGGTQDEISYFLDKTEDKIFGYILPNKYLSAKKFAEVIQVGSTTPITPAEQNEFGNKLIKVLRNKYPGNL